MLNTTKKIENGNLFVTFEGRLDTLTSPVFEKEIEEVLPGSKSVTLDFANLEYISSAGLRTLLSIQQYMEENGFPNVKVLNVSDVIMETFELTGFDGMLDIG
ncbi:MAG: STAS domain-containing protein [Lachnospiraceae bacterium]|nr:STAS domain-containing protein [Lachnospiraceae bacterium]